MESGMMSVNVTMCARIIMEVVVSVIFEGR